ncbi:MAG: hypothetical protein A3C04_03625 [Candidatus Wildermuthbacteria bacterium RIFCSPHIGHO2_02_FULL_45_25]|uniref:Glycosyltransferase 2-like domain-containing protein n=1 Tax=Candidatus Wildermuthbacteria bacterium RIFCSPHIGHO2_02_FULL_45_25 TaxID=1802450 RepID=A0A1G2R2R5_9BACT|nr:MAG: hypothetical protein A3C04_03625 [Candidatus Wildermuthbacteria bacterium RIFCSPHIGHO2_02_FULL_45_25]
MKVEQSSHKVLVCVPVWNVKEELGKTLESVSNQTYQNFDLLILDNKSTDETWEIASTFTQKYPNQAYAVQNEKNLGRIGNWNRCLEWFEKTQHTYIKFVFSGDLLEKNALEVLMKGVDDNANIGLVAAGYAVHEEKSTIAKISFPTQMNFMPPQAMERFCKEGNWVGAPFSCMIAKSSMKGARFKEGFEWAADVLFFIDVAASAPSLYIPQKIGIFEVAKRKYYQKYRNSDLAQVENLYIKYYAVEKLKKMDEKLATSMKEQIKKEDGKTIFFMLSFITLFELFGRELARRIRRGCYKNKFYMSLRQICIFLIFIRIAKWGILKWLFLAGKEKYVYMQKTFYNYHAVRSHYQKDSVQDRVVGSYEAHNVWPDYNEFLMKYVDENYKGKIALDFGCGPGRNIIQYSKRFKRLDGVDISEENIKHARENLSAHGIAHANLYVNNGVDLREMLDKSYDFVMSTITLQHICVYEIRFNLLKEFYRIVKKGGRISLQMGYGKDAPDSVSYEANNYEAFTTNRGCDVRIERIEQLKKDIEKIGFQNFEYWIRPTGPGDTHPYWIFFTAIK